MQEPGEAGFRWNAREVRVGRGGWNRGRKEGLGDSEVMVMVMQTRNNGMLCLFYSKRLNIMGRR